MALTNAYVTLEDVKTRLGGAAVDGGDPQLEQAITSACRAIDVHCGQFFYDAGSATARTFRPGNRYRLMVPPFSTTTGLAVKTDTGDDGTFATTWASTDYELDYFADDSTNPYDTVAAVGSYVFPISNRRLRCVQVTARWGWTAPPQNVIEAARILSVDLWKRKDTPFGIATGSIDFGGLRIGRDTMAGVASLLQTHVRADRMIGIA
jgi:hypothetical protein